MLEFHRKMLGDRVRNDAFYEALKRAMKPGVSVVADIGSGTGFLSFLARKLGAKECHLYEMGDVLELSKRLASENHIDHVRFVHRHSTKVQRPTQADIVVAEVLGNFALEEHIIETMNDARERFLKPNGILIPGKVAQFVCPVVTDRLRKDIDTWNIGYGLDYAAARAMGFHNAYVKTIHVNDLLAEGKAAQQFDAIDFAVENQSRRSASVQWKLDADAVVHGFAVWWEAELLPGITLSTSPAAPLTHWEQIYLPVPDFITAKKDDVLALSLSSDTRFEVGMNLTWQAFLLNNGTKKEISPLMDMRRGHLD